MLPKEKWEESREEAKDLAQDYLDREETRANCIKYFMSHFKISNATNPNFIEDASYEAEIISASLIKLSDADLINKRKDLFNSINKIIELLNEMGVDE